jgi:hypothetical protein
MFGFLFTASVPVLYSQYHFLKAEESEFFGRVSVLGGITSAYDNSADDHYRLGVRVPLPWRFHLTAGTGFRPVSPLTIVGVLGLETDIFRTNRQRVKGVVNHSYLFRLNNLFFDHQIRKTTVGLGYECIPFYRIGAGAEYMPFGFYHGTRHDNPEKGNPSATGARELRIYLFFVF